MDKRRTRDDLDNIAAELLRLVDAVAAYKSSPAEFSPKVSPDWIIKNSITTILQSVYTNLENVLASILKGTDNYRPGGENFHRELLARAAAPIEQVREPLISEPLKQHLVELLGFRHVARKRYAQEIDLELALQNVDRAEIAVPMFAQEIERFLLTQPDD